MPIYVLLPCWFCAEIDMNYITHEYTLLVMMIGIWPYTPQESSRSEEGRSDHRWVSVPLYRARDFLPKPPFLGSALLSV